MGKATFNPVTAADGSAQLQSESRQVMAHGIMTVLLLVTLMAAAWGFMDWVVAPSACPTDSAQSTGSSSSPPAALVAAPRATSPAAPRSPQAGASRDIPGWSGLSPTRSTEPAESVSSPASYSARVEMALHSECSCP
jgi:hypothetical protein